MAGITSTKKIKGQPHLLAYITPNEVEKLKALGGQETMTPEGIPAYPESEYYGVSQADFKRGDFTRSTDDNVRNLATGKTGVSAAQLAAINAKEKEKERQKAKEEILLNSKVGRNKPLNRFQIYNAKIQRQRNLELAKKRAFQKYKDVEQYVDPFDDYEMSGQKMAEKRGYVFDDQGNIIGYDRNKATAYGYDTSALEKGMDTLTSNRGTSIEKTRPNLYDVNSLDHPIANAIRPDTQRTVLNTLGKAAEYNVLGINAPNMTNQQINDEMYRLRNLGRTDDQIKIMEGGGGGGGGAEAYIPYLPPEETEEVVEETTFPYHLGLGGQKVGRDVTLGYAANGGRITRAGGGIMNAVPRKRFFLGGIGDAIGDALGGVAKAAGKVLKSDLGKAAVAGAMFYYGGGGGMPKFLGGKGLGGFSPSTFFSKANPLLFTNNKMSVGKLFGMSAVLPYLFGEAKQDPSLMATREDTRLIDPITGEEATPAEMRANIENAKIEADGDPVKLAALNQKYNNMLFTNKPYPNYGIYAAQGGRIPAQEGGLMDLGGMEKDYRNEGGFVPIGREEKADDVPARLSVNEFVFTADAVRNAGGGDIDKGAEVMENMMKNLENGGRVSEESQGNTGAQEMFSVSERIGEVI